MRQKKKTNIDESPLVLVLTLQPTIRKETVNDETQNKDK